MSPELAAIREHRARLVVRAAAQRDQVGRLSRECARPLLVADRVLGAWRFVRGQPALVAAALALVAAALALVVTLKPARALSWSVRGWLLLQAVRRVWPHFTEPLFGHGERKP